jgi:hypothetical protein
MPPTARSPRFEIPTAMDGCFRKSRPGCPAADSVDVATLTELLQDAEKHHSEYEPTAPKHHWPDWYAAYIVARQDGKTPEEAAKDGKIHIEGVR